MRRINLLPSDERGRAAERFGGGVLGILLIAGALVVVVMVGVYLLMLLRLNGLEEEVAKLDNDIAQQNARLAELSPYRDLQAQLEAKKPIADGIYSTRFAWDQFLQGLAFVVPETTALDTMTAEASPVDIEATPEQPLDPAGTVEFTGIALPQFENVADFIVRMDNLQYLANAELDSAERQGNSQSSPVNFTVTSALVTIAGENGSEVKLEDASDNDLAAREGSLSTREVAHVGRRDAPSAAGEKYAPRKVGGDAR
jgi:type IV pilus assembly protein PilN